jgi:glycine/D-amino acid oxidase-like deaminating enzyme
MLLTVSLESMIAVDDEPGTNGGYAVNIVVIGAGVVGSSLAWRLAQQGVDVTLVERASAASGTTGSSFAWFNANQKTPEDYFALNLAGMDMHRALRDELDTVPWMHEGGNLVWATSDAGESDLETRVARLQSWGYPAEWLSRQDVGGLEPRVRPEVDVEQFAYFPTEGWVDGPLLAQTMCSLAAESGATLRFACEVTKINRDGDRVTGVTLANGEQIAADLVVNCAGPAADRVASLAGRTLPMAQTLGLIVRVTPGNDAIGRVIHAPNIHMRPDSNGLLMLHHHDSDDAITNGEAPNVWAETLRQRLVDYLPELEGVRVSRWSVGTRPIPADDRTSAGLVPSLPGYAEIVTHSAITMGPLLGKLVASEIVNGEVDPLLKPFHPERFGE